MRALVGRWSAGPASAAYSLGLSIRSLAEQATDNSRLPALRAFVKRYADMLDPEFVQVGASVLKVAITPFNAWGSSYMYAGSGCC